MGTGRLLLEVRQGLPWATREQLIRQLYNLLDFEDLDDAERLTVVEQIAVLSELVDSDGRRPGAGRPADQEPRPKA